MTREIGEGTMTFETLLLEGDFIPQSKNNYLWDDWSKCNELVSNNEDLYIYTVVTDEDKLWVNEGKWLINRVGHLFSRVPVKLETDVEY